MLILIVDDNFPDGTADKVRELMTWGIRKIWWKMNISSKIVLSLLLREDLASKRGTLAKLNLGREAPTATLGQKQVRLPHNLGYQRRPSVCAILSA
jgi:hypothetical protein